MFFSGNPSIPNGDIAPIGGINTGLSFNDYLVGQIRHTVPEVAQYAKAGFEASTNAGSVPEIVTGALVRVQA